MKQITLGKKSYKELEKVAILVEMSGGTFHYCNNLQIEKNKISFP